MSCRSFVLLLGVFVLCPTSALLAESPGITIHGLQQELTHPSVERTPTKASVQRREQPLPAFENKGFRYGDNIRYDPGIRYGRRGYFVGTQMRRTYRDISGIRYANGRYRPNTRMNPRSYRPNMRYADGVQYGKNRQYGLSK